METNGIIAVLIGLLLPAVQKVFGDGSVFQGLSAGQLVPAVNQLISALIGLLFHANG